MSSDKLSCSFFFFFKFTQVFPKSHALPTYRFFMKSAEKSYFYFPLCISLRHGKYRKRFVAVSANSKPLSRSSLRNICGPNFHCRSVAREEFFFFFSPLFSHRRCRDKNRLAGLLVDTRINIIMYIYGSVFEYIVPKKTLVKSSY